MKKQIFILIILLICCYVSESQCNSSVTYQSQVICEGVVYAFYGTGLTVGGTYNDTRVLAGGCDSIISLQLEVLPIVYTNISSMLCPGLSYNFYGRMLSQTGMYYDTLYAANTFCDSIIVLTLTSGTTTPTRTEYDTLCHGSSLTLYGTLYYPGQYSLVMPSTTGGCDSIITLHVIDGRKTSTISFSGCAGQVINYHGHIYTIPSYSLDTTMISSTGCDSLVYVDLTLFSRVIHLTLPQCQSISYASHTFTQAGVYIDTLLSSSGCDTIGFFFVSTLNPLVRVNLYSCFDSVEYNGRYFAVPGFYTDTLSSLSSSCDSLVILQTYSGTASGYEYIPFCPGQNFTHHGHIDSIPGYYSDTLISAGGCDSIINVNAEYTYLWSQISVNGCAGQTYLYNGHAYTFPGNYIDTIHLASGCDSLIYLVLDTNVVNRFYYIRCLGDTFIYRGQVYTFPSTISDTLTSLGGCDSIVEISLYQLTGYATAYGTCGQNYMFNGKAYMVPGSYFDTLTSSSGCDSLVALTLYANTVGAYNDTIHLSTCLAYLTYNSDNTIYTFNTSGLYALNYTGCDTMYYAYVTLHAAPYIRTTTMSICPGQSVMFRGVTYSLPLNYDYSSIQISYSDTVSSTSQACDSIFSLVLNVFPIPPLVYITDSFCQGSTYHYKGYSFTEAGEDTVYIPGTLYCDTVVMLTLNYREAQIPSITETDSLLTASISAGVSYQWLLNGQAIPGANSRNYKPLTNGSYTVVVTSLTDSVCYNISLPYVVIGLSINGIPDDADFSIYPNPNNGSFTLVSKPGAASEISIYDLQGRIVHRQLISKSIETIEMNISDGTYILMLKENEGYAYKKLVIAK